MKDNRLAICIRKPVSEVFAFTITPPNSTLWINSITKEETNEWPIHKGTRYTLKNKDGETSEVTVIAIKENKSVEWISADQNYHCRYTYSPIDKTQTKLAYYEWVDKGEISDPFTVETLEKLKAVLENE